MKKLFRLLLLAVVIIGIIVYVPKIIEYIFPFSYNGYIETYSEKYGVDKYLAYAIIKAESNFNKDTVSRRGAKGLMQIMDKTAAWCADKIGKDGYDLFEPEDNIELGTFYVAYLLDYYDGNEQNAVAAYNAGHGNVDSWLSNSEYSKNGKTLDVIPFEETDKYVKKIMFYRKIYAWRDRNYLTKD